MANVTLVTRDRQEQATHAVLLASVSPLMKAMLMEVQVTEEATTIILPDFTREEVELCLNSLFRGSKDHLNTSLLNLLDLKGAGKEEKFKDEVVPKCEAVELKDEELSDWDYQSDNDDAWDNPSSPPTPTSSFPCFYCEKKFTTTKRRKCHIELEHQQLLEAPPEFSDDELKEEEGSFPCSLCPNKSRTQKTLNQHMSKCHEEQCEWFPHIEEKGGKWFCKICNTSYSKKNKGIIHWRRIHKLGKVEFECTVCNKMFSSKHNMVEHNKLHTKSKDAICDLCGDAFKSKRELKNHVLRLHGSEKEKEEMKKFVCTTCGKGFYHECSLKDHEYVHLDQLSFFCEKCGSGFRTSNALRIHENRIHLKKWVETEEQKAKRNALKRQRRAEAKARNGGSQRTPEEKIIFNEYMRQYMARKKRTKEHSFTGDTGL